MAAFPSVTNLEAFFEAFFFSIEGAAADEGAAAVAGAATASR
jgi:hypothetical protein